MNKEKLTEQLEFLGLSNEQATIYLCLLERGFIKAGKIPEYTGIKRGLAYKILDQLIEMGFVKKHGDDALVARYAPLSPEHLEKFVNDKLALAKSHQDTFDDLYGNLKSQFNLLSGRPSVRYFEGTEGVVKMLEDSLDTQDIMYTYGDAESVYEYFADINEKHSQERKAHGIKKCILMTDNAAGRKAMAVAKKDPLTDIKVIKKESVPIGAVTEIYDNKVSFFTFSDLGQSGVLIEDQQIAKMHKFIFEALFGKSKFTKTKNQV